MPGVIAVGAGSGFSSVKMTPTIPPVADTDTPPVASLASRFVATRWIDSPTFSNFTTGVATVADVMAPVEDDVPGAGAPSRNPNTVAPKFATAKSVTLTVSVPVAYRTMPGVTAVGAGSGFSSVRMIPTIPPVADTDTPPVPSFASRFVATRWIDSPTFSNFTTGVATVADVIAPVADDVPGAGAPSRNPNFFDETSATEKSGKFVFASMLLAIGTVTPLAEIELSVNCLDVVFTLIVTSPFTAAKSVTLTVSVPVAYRTMPGVTAVGAGSGFSSVRMIPTI